MKKLLKASLLLPLLVLFTACPYESTVPISNADIPVDKKFLGNWYKEGEMDKEYPSEYYEIKTESPETYKITKYDLNTDDNSYKQEVYISHITYFIVENDNNYSFLNMKKDGKYYLHRIKLSDTRFVLYELTDNIDEKFNTVEEMRKFVEKNMTLSFFYNKDEVTYYKGDHTMN